ncbi:MAG: DNA internalization-related competence protein ComEC/Rec2 [Candidatus Omnitrophota bacterium]|nr:DNA internalization-related competence protein ComEC/Rec2 [Candidatus Omnitrophota bacterium]
MKRPALYCAISFCIGIVLANLLDLPVVCPMSLSFIFIILAALLFRNNTLSHVFLYLALVCFGAAHYQNYNTLPDNQISNFAAPGAGKVFLKGVVIDDPVIKKAFYNKNKISFTMEAISIRRDSTEEKATGLVKTDIYTSGEVHPPNAGDELVAEGNLSRPEGLKNPGLFDYSRYLAIKNIYAVLTVGENNFIEVIRSGRINPVMGWAYRVRRDIRDAITGYTDKRYSGFLNAILIGERSELDSSITDDFVKTGTVHVIAISGLNIALVAGIFLMIFKFLGIRKKPNLVLTSLAIVFYCFVAGSSPPVVRATVVFVIASVGYIINRESDILNSLSLAAFFILLANPKELFDPSFQLSFGSVISIILFAPRIEEVFDKNKNYVVKSVAVSIAASMGVFPIVARYFNIVSPVAIFANLVIVPALFVLTVASFIFLVLNIIGAVFFLNLMGAALSMLTGATFYINHLFAQIPLSHIRIPAPSPFFICAYYSFLAYMLLVKNRKHILAALLIAMNIIVWTQDIGCKQLGLKIAFLDVGKGDSAVIEFPGKGTMLVDGGSGGIESSFDVGKNVVAPYLWNRSIYRLDAVVVSHFHEDHMGGLLYILKNFDIGCVMDNGIVPEEDRRLYDEYREIVYKRGIRRLVIAADDEITGFGDTRLYVLNPPEGQDFSNPNDSSIVIKLEYKTFGAIFTGDVSSEVMERIISYGGLLRSDVLKIPHHGGSLGKESVADRFFRQISAPVSVTSSGGKYRYGPKKNAKYISGTTNYDTKVNGAVTIFTKGDGFNVEPFCQKN